MTDFLTTSGESSVLLYFHIMAAEPGVFRDPSRRAAVDEQAGGRNLR
jgi:hypothetical protein